MSSKDRMEKVRVFDSQNDPDMKSPGATFERVGAGVSVLNTPQSMGALQRVRVETKDLRDLVDEFVRDLTATHLSDLKASERIREELGRRIEIAAKNATPRIEREVDAALKEVIADRVRKIVADLEILVVVSVNQKGA